MISMCTFYHVQKYISTNVYFLEEKKHSPKMIVFTSYLWNKSFTYAKLSVQPLVQISLHTCKQQRCQGVLNHDVRCKLWILVNQNIWIPNRNLSDCVLSHNFKVLCLFRTCFNFLSFLYVHQMMIACFQTGTIFRKIYVMSVIVVKWNETTTINIEG